MNHYLLHIVLFFVFFSGQFSFGSVRCGEDAHPKNKLTKEQLIKAKIFHICKTKDQALKRLKEGYLIDLRQSNQALRDDEDFLLKALETYPTVHQLAASASNCHDITPKDPKIYDLASERLRNKKSFKAVVLSSKYGKYFLKQKRKGE